VEANFIDQHRKMISEAAGLVVGVADDSGASLIDVIAEVERYIIEKTKVGDATEQTPPPDRRGYTLVNGRLVETSPAVQPQAAQPSQTPKKKHKKRSRPRPISNRTQRDAGRVGSMRR